MKVLFYSIHDFELPYLKAIEIPDIIFSFTPEPLSAETAPLAEGYDAVSIFTSDDASAPVLVLLQSAGVKFIAVRAVGFDNIDLSMANEIHIRAANVPEYSPNAIAEHTVAMMLALDRKLITANEQVRKQNFTVSNLVGFDLNKKKVGIIGTGRIGCKVARILHGFGCTLLAYDKEQNVTLEKYDVLYTDMEALCSTCDIITIHVPLNVNTRYLIDEKLIKSMKPGVMLINTSRGAIINTQHVIDALRTGQIGYYGMDVYEHEKGLFFHDHSADPVKDPMLKELMNFPNVLLTPHQAFATNEALSTIAETTLHNLSEWNNGGRIKNEITAVESLVV